MIINPSIDVIEQHAWGVLISNHHGYGITIEGETYTDVEFRFTIIAYHIGKLIGLTHLIYFTQTNEINN